MRDQTCVGVSIRCEASGGVIDIPGGEAKVGIKLITYNHHGGDNQVLIINDEGRVRSKLDPDMFLMVDEDGSLVLGRSRRDDGRDQWIWNKDTGVVQCLGVDDVVLTEVCGGQLRLESQRDECPYQQWSLVEADSVQQARPATSCHLKYPLPSHVDTCHDWELRCSVTVLHTCPATYFCVVGWGPGGYSGIQQVDEDRRVAIFSMWNNCEHKVELLSQGPNAIVDNFGGEGTGLKTMMDVDWSPGEIVTFTVTGVQDGEAWICSCYFTHQGLNHFLASYRRTGPRPLSRNGFYSFVEDWDRSGGAEGHLTCRRATFSKQSLRIKDKEVKLSSAVFTKVEHGRDKFACSKAKGGVCKIEDDASFFLSTGGLEDDEEDEKNITRTHNSELSLE